MPYPMKKIVESQPGEASQRCAMSFTQKMVIPGLEAPRSGSANIPAEDLRSSVCSSNNEYCSPGITARKSLLCVNAQFLTNSLVVPPFHYCHDRG